MATPPTYVGRHLFTAAAGLGLLLLVVLIVIVVLALSSQQAGFNATDGLSRTNQGVLCRVELRQWEQYHPGERAFPTNPPVDVCGISIPAFEHFIVVDPALQQAPPHIEQ